MSNLPLITIIKKYWYFIALGCIAVIFFLLSLLRSTAMQTSSKNIPLPTPVSVNPSASPFTITGTFPKNNDVEVLPGNIDIQVMVNQQLSANPGVSLVATPSFTTQDITHYPTNKLSYQITAGLLPKTTYAVRLINASGQTFYYWRFTTAAGESSSDQIAQQAKAFHDKETPLLDYTPYTTSDFVVDYEGPLKLHVQAKIADTTKVKQEVEDWMRSHGVDPSTHTLDITTQ